MYASILFGVFEFIKNREVFMVISKEDLETTRRENFGSSKKD
jgi:hypothetical protein